MAHKTGPFRFETPAGRSHYTRLFACISEEEDGYMVQVRLSNEKRPENNAWGEEIVDSFETASELVAALAGEFSIAQAGIEMEIRMHNHISRARDIDPPRGVRRRAASSFWGPPLHRALPLDLGWRTGHQSVGREEILRHRVR